MNTSNKQLINEMRNLIVSSGLSIPKLNDLWRDAACEEKVLSDDELRRRYSGLYRNRGGYYLAKRVGGKYGRIDMPIADTQSDAIRIYITLNDEINKYKANETGTVPTLDRLRDRRPEVKMTIGEYITANRSGLQVSRLSHILKNLTDKTPATITEFSVQGFLKEMVLAGLKDDAVKKNFNYLCKTIRLMTDGRGPNTRK